MSLPNLQIQIHNGALGRITATSDGVAGLILTGKAVPEKLELYKVYVINSIYGLTSLGVTEANNPLVYKDVSAFYAQAGDGAELYLMVVDKYTVNDICSTSDDSPIRRLVDYGKGRIRLIGVNVLPDYEGFNPDNTISGISHGLINAAQSAQNVGLLYEQKINPIRIFIPAMYWNKNASKAYQPRQSIFNRVAFVMACDKIYPNLRYAGNYASPAIGQVLGRAASSPVDYSIARVKSGAIAATGYLSDGSTPEESAAYLNQLHDAGYIIYRTFPSKSGYYLNDDCMATSLADDYSGLSLGRVIDKALIITHSVYVDQINDVIAVDKNGYIPIELCRYLESGFEHAMAIRMNDKIISFSAHINPQQNIFSTGRMEVDCKIVPKGTLREIHVTLGFENPAK